MKKFIKDIYGHSINRDRIIEILNVIDKKENEQRIKINIKSMGTCGNKTILLHNGPTWISQTKINRLKDFVFLSKNDMIDIEELKQVIFRKD